MGKGQRRRGCGNPAAPRPRRGLLGEPNEAGLRREETGPRRATDAARGTGGAPLTQRAECREPRGPAALSPGLTSPSAAGGTSPVLTVLQAASSSCAGPGGPSAAAISAHPLPAPRAAMTHRGARR